MTNANNDNLSPPSQAPSSFTINLNDQLKKTNSDNANLLALAMQSLMQELDPKINGALSFLMGLCIEHLGQGKTFVTLDEVIDDLNVKAQEHQGDAHKQYLSKEDWLKIINCSPLVGKNAERPWVLHGERFYLARYWQYEQDLLQSLTQRAQILLPIDLAQAKASLTCLFPNTVSAVGSQEKSISLNNHLNWQKMAVAQALFHTLHIIIGGPGTGKTSTVTRLLVAIIEQYQHNKQACQIALCAPTGKAASHLLTAIQQAQKHLNLNEFVQKSLPTKALTIHRLLQWHPSDLRPKYHRENTLPFDVVVVDEASMLDLAAWNHLLSALSQNTRIIFLGDAHQLDAISPGSVLADLVQGLGVHLHQQQPLNELMSCELSLPLPLSLLGHVMTELKESHRFDEQSAIGLLAKSVLQGDVTKTFELLEKGGELLWVPDDQFSQLMTYSVQAYQQLFHSLSQKSMSDFFDTPLPFQILCATHDGMTGTQNINAQLDSFLYKWQAHLNRLSDTQNNAREIHTPPVNSKNNNGWVANGQNELWYAGRLILIEENATHLHLNNGDVGICQFDKGLLKVFFKTERGLVSVLPLQLPKHSSAWAISIHKSQGSEYQEVLVTLPPAPHHLLNRNLLYTAITRARQKVRLFSSKQSIVSAIGCEKAATTGLSQQIMLDTPMFQGLD